MHYLFLLHVHILLHIHNSTNIGNYKHFPVDIKIIFASKDMSCFFFFLIFFGCVGSSFLCKGFLQLWRAGATLHRGARASYYRGLSCCGAQAPDAQAQQLWLTGPVAPWHVRSSQTRARTRVPCIGRQILNHCATREAHELLFDKSLEQKNPFETL